MTISGSDSFNSDVATTKQTRIEDLISLFYWCFAYLVLGLSILSILGNGFERFIGFLLGTFFIGWYIVFPAIKSALTLKSTYRIVIIGLFVTSFILYSMGGAAFYSNSLIRAWQIFILAIVPFVFGFSILLYKKYK